MTEAKKNDETITTDLSFTKKHFLQTINCVCAFYHSVLCTTDHGIQTGLDLKNAKEKSAMKSRA